jgi:hypothetical protein
MASGFCVDEVSLMTFNYFAFKLALSAISLCAVLEVRAAFSDESRLPHRPKDFAAMVRRQLPVGWHCTYDFRTVVISHDEQVTYLNMLGLPGNEHNDEFYKEYGVQGPYLIVMKFVLRLSEAEQRALSDSRRQAVDKARIGRKPEEKYTGSDVYERHFVPEYFNDGFSIDMQTSDSWPLRLVAPADVVEQRDAILKLLQAKLKRYPTDPPD